MKPLEIITVILAVYGAFLSSLNYRIQAKSKKWRIVVSPIIGSINKKKFLAFRAANLGERTVTLSSFYVRFQSPQLNRFKRIMRFILIVPYLKRVELKGEGFYLANMVIKRDAEFPYDLLPGRSFEISLDTERLINYLSSHARGIVRICGSFEDQTGLSYETFSYLKVDLTNTTINL